jgi:hypothetical protein
MSGYSRELFGAASTVGMTEAEAVSEAALEPGAALDVGRYAFLDTRGCVDAGKPDLYDAITAKAGVDPERDLALSKGADLILSETGLP